MADLTQGQKVRLGVFLGTGLAVLAGATILLAGRALIEDRDTYRIRFASKAASFAGLSVGSDVTYSGIRIGRVETLEVAPDDVSVIAVGISVTEGTPIAVDSKASLGSQGITGMKYIDISRGSAGTRLRRAGDLIPAGDSLIDTLTDQAASIGAKLDGLLVNLQAMTGSKSRQTMEKILTETAGLVADNRGNIAAVIANARSASADLAVLVRAGAGVMARTDRVLADVGAVTHEMRRALAPRGEVAGTLAKVTALVDGLSMVVLRSQGDLDVTMRHVRNAAADMADFSQAIKDNPTLLMFGADAASDKRIGK